MAQTLLKLDTVLWVKESEWCFCLSRVKTGLPQWHCAFKWSFLERQRSHLPDTSPVLLTPSCCLAGAHQVSLIHVSVCSLSVRNKTMVHRLSQVGQSNFRWSFIVKPLQSFGYSSFLCINLELFPPYYKVFNEESVFRQAGWWGKRLTFCANWPAHAGLLVINPYLSETSYLPTCSWTHLYVYWSPRRGSVTVVDVFHCDALNDWYLCRDNLYYRHNMQHNTETHILTHAHVQCVYKTWFKYLTSNPFTWKTSCTGL